MMAVLLSVSDWVIPLIFLGVPLYAYYRGVAVYDSSSLTHIPTYPVKAVDTTAAGDSFTAAMTLEFMRSHDIIRACRFGNAVASITVSKQGAGDSIPDCDELEQFIKDNGIVI